MAKPELTENQRRFVDEYLIDLNATQAYRRANPKATYMAAAVEAHKLLKLPKIAAEIRAARKVLSKRSRITAERVLREYARIAFSDVGETVTPDGKIAPLRSIPLEARRAIASVKSRTRPDGETEVEYKLWPKTEALNKLFAHLGLSSEITPLDALLATLPKRLSEEVRAAIAGTVLPERDPEDADAVAE